MNMTSQQQARFEAWKRDCQTTHPDLATSVEVSTLPSMLRGMRSSGEVDQFLTDLENILRDNRSRAR